MARKLTKGTQTQARPTELTPTEGTPTFGAELIEDMELVLAHVRGEVELEQVWPKPLDIKAIRRQVKMTQAEFSQVYCISKRALQEWEQGGRQPDSAARAYLKVIAKEPALVREALLRD